METAPFRKNAYNSSETVKKKLVFKERVSPKDEFTYNDLVKLTTFLTFISFAIAMCVSFAMAEYDYTFRFAIVALFSYVINFNARYEIKIEEEIVISRKKDVDSETHS